VHGVRGGEPFGYAARFSGKNACKESQDTFIMAHDLVDTPLEGCHDVFVHEESPSLGSNHVLPSPLEHSHVSTFCSQCSLSPKYTIDVPIDNFELCVSNVDLGNMNNVLNVHGGNVETFESLGIFSGYDAALDPYCICLVDKPRKIMWHTFFDYSFNFSLAFSLMKRALVFFALILSYSLIVKLGNTLLRSVTSFCMP